MWLLTCCPEQPAGVAAVRRSLLTDEFLRVKGSDGSIWAFGDAATIDQPRALQRADELFEQADVDKVCALRRSAWYAACADMCPACCSGQRQPASQQPAQRSNAFVIHSVSVLHVLACA